MTENVPPATLTGVGALIPEITAPTDVIVVFNATPVCAGKVKASGVVSAAAASVVAQNDPAMPPMVSVAQVCVLLPAAEVRPTLTVFPLATADAALP